MDLCIFLFDFTSLPKHRQPIKLRRYFQMFKRELLLCIVLVSATLLGCSTSKEYYIDPTYEKQKVDTSVLVLPLQRDWFQGQFTHTFGTLNGPGQTTFYNSMQPLLAKSLTSNIQMIEPGTSFDSKMFRSSKLKFGSDSLSVLIPDQQSNFSMSGSQPEIILLLDKYFFRKQRKAVGGSSYAGHEGGSTKTVLQFETKYIYWNTKQHKPIAWGNTASSVTLGKSPDVTNSDYELVLSKALDKMVKRSPIM
jgi:hypothetical protein